MKVSNPSWAKWAIAALVLVILYGWPGVFRYEYGPPQDFGYGEGDQVLRLDHLTDRVMKCKPQAWQVHISPGVQPAFWGLAGLCVLFVWPGLLRYQYISRAGDDLTRIDRLTKRVTHWDGKTWKP